MLFEWQQQDFKYFLSAIHQARLPHAILFSGLKGISKLGFCDHLAAFLHCHKPLNKNERCGDCHSCQLIDAQTHPDLKVIKPEGKASEIKIDQIRKLDDFVGQTAVLGQKRIVIINQSERMNINAANALLKMLEEPGKDCHFLLTCSQRQKLLPTIQSRCQVYALKEPTAAQSHKWLETNSVSGNELELLESAFPHQPLYIKQLLDSKDIEAVVKLEKQFLLVLKQQLSISQLKFEKTALEQIDLLFEVLQRQIHLALKNKMALIESGSFNGKPLLGHLQQCNDECLIKSIDILQQCRQSDSLTNLNKQLMLESLFFNLRKLLA